MRTRDRKASGRSSAADARKNPAGDADHVQRLAHSAGNAAVARLVQRRALTKASGRPALQRATIIVPFNGRGAGGFGDTLVTTGLMNCIAVGVRDPDRSIGAFSHIQTSYLFKNDDEADYDDEDAPPPLVADMPAYARYKQDLLDTLRTKLGSGEELDEARLAWDVWLGVVWKHEREEDSAMWRQLRAALVSTFGVEPGATTGQSAQFDVTFGGIMGVSSGAELEQRIPGGSANPEMQDQTNPAKVLWYIPARSQVGQ